MNIQTNFSQWLTDNQGMIVSIAITVLVVIIVIHFGERLIHRAVARTIRAAKHQSRTEELKREKTVSQIISRMLKVLIWPFAIMSIVAQLGVEVAPLIAGAGIIGLAIGFGAQTLVKDMIAGLFIVIENQYGVGDVVDLDGTSGTVEEITLRKTRLRDAAGVVHHVPNGTIMRASNMSSEFSGINLNVGVAYDSDIAKVTEVINTIGEQLAKDAKWEDRILEAPHFVRVDNFGPFTVDVRIMGKVIPLSQWDVTGELRQRLIKAFTKAGIDMPTSPLMAPEPPRKRSN